MSNRQFRLARRPTGRMERSNFELTIGEVPVAGAETIVEGLEAAPEALNLLFDGGNTGKLLVKVAT